VITKLKSIVQQLDVSLTEKRTILRILKHLGRANAEDEGGYHRSLSPEMTDADLKRKLRDKNVSTFAKNLHTVSKPRPQFSELKSLLAAASAASLKKPIVAPPIKPQKSILRKSLRGNKKFVSFKKSEMSRPRAIFNPIEETEVTASVQASSYLKS
jgi:hypothetical protein